MKQSLYHDEYDRVHSSRSVDAVTEWKFHFIVINIVHEITTRDNLNMRNYEYEYENDWKLMKLNIRVNSNRQQTTNNIFYEEFEAEIWCVLEQEKR